MVRRNTWLAFCLLIVATTAFAAKPADVDVQAEQAVQAPRALSPAELLLVKPGKTIQYEERRGVPTFIWAAPSAAGEKKARAARVSSVARPDAVGEALRNAAAYASFYGLEKGDFASARVVEVHDTGVGSIIVKLREEVGGIEVFREEMSVMMDRGLEPIAISGYLSGAARKIAANPVSFRLDERAVAAIAIADRTGKAMTVPELAPTGARQVPAGDVEHGARTQRLPDGEPGQPASPLSDPVRDKQV
jgi:hypothetical protein